MGGHSGRQLLQVHIEALKLDPDGIEALVRFGLTLPQLANDRALMGKIHRRFAPISSEIASLRCGYVIHPTFAVVTLFFCPSPSRHRLTVKLAACERSAAQWGGGQLESSPR